MGLELDQHAPAMASLGTDALELVRASWPQACNAFGASGIHVYLAGLRVAAAAGPVFGTFAAYVRSAPDIAEEVGPESVDRVVGVVGSLRDELQPVQLEQILSASAVAARRLGDPRLFAAFLQLVRECARLDAAALSMVLDRLDLLLGKLTVAGLRGWVIRGLRAHPQDLDQRRAYFRLESEEGIQAIAAESEGALLVTVERQLDLFTRALAHEPPRLRAVSGSGQLEERRPYLEKALLRLPDAYPHAAGGSGSEMYRAAVAHALGHLRFSPARQPVGRLKPMAIVVVSLIEDARIEQLMIREYPGLQKLWSRFHTAMPDSDRSFDSLTRRLSRALIDPAYDDGNYWVNKGRALFEKRRPDLDDYAAFRQIASILGNDLGQMRVRFNDKTFVVEPAYRDDNRYLWQFPDDSAEQYSQAGDVLESVRPEHGPGEAPLEVVPPPQPSSAQDTDAKVTLVAVPPWAASVSPPVKYPEWDHLISAERPAWCTVVEKDPPRAAATVVTGILQRYRVLVGRIRSLVRGVQVQKPQRTKRQPEGDDIDLNAAISAMISIRSAQTPDPRVHVRVGRRARDLAVLVLLDVSESTNDRVGGTFSSVLDLSREATVLLADAMDRIGDAFAIHAFASNGRHEVEYYRLKDFDRPYDQAARERLAGIRGQLSTRMGTAIRHAGQFLRYRRSARKLVLLITDGEPSDIDVQDPQYLRLDAKKAVESIQRFGIHTFCMTVDKKADEYVKRIFGASNYMVVDRIGRLPEQLPQLYMRVTHGWS